MKTTILTLILMTAIVSAACVGSVQPFYDERNVYFDRTLVGTWIDPEGQETWKVQQHGEKKTYLIDQTDDEGRTTRFEARLFKIGERSFIDLVATRSGNSTAKQVFAAHTFVAIEKDRCTSRMSYLDPAWLKNYLARDLNAVRHTNLNGEIVFTDSTKNLQAFIRKHFASPGAFEQTETLYKKGETQCEQRN